MKKLLTAASVGMVLAMSAGAAQAADKIAVVNIGEVVQKMPGREAAAKQLESEFKSRGTELQSLEKDLQTRAQKLQKDGATMKDSERQKLAGEFDTQRADFAKKAQAFDQDFQKRQMEERNKVMKRVEDAVKSVASKGGYDVVIDANAVAYSVSGIDITADVLKQVK